LTLGKIVSLLWSWENEDFSGPALFLFECWSKTAFDTTDANQQFWKKYYCIQIFIYTIICFKTHTVDVIGRVTLSNKLTIIFVSWSNVAFMLVLVSDLFYCIKRNLL
jgi:uncharacterized protein